jgi:hypothetical protein
MFRTTAIGTVCLALICLGSGMTYREVQAQEGETDLIVIEGKVNATEVPAAEKGEVGKALVEGDGKLVEIQIGGDSKNPAAVRSELRIDAEGNRSTTLLNEEGKVIERRTVTAPARTGAVRLLNGPQVADPETRSEIDKLIVRLEEEIRKLQAEGRAEEAEKKLQSIRALKQLLAEENRITARTRIFRADGTAPQAQAQEEMVRSRQALSAQLSRLPEAERRDGLKRLATRRHELAAEIAKVPEQDKEQRALLGAKIAELDRLLAEEQKSLTPPVLSTASVAFYRTLARNAETDNLQRAIEKVATHRKTLGEQLAKVSEANAEERAKLQNEIAQAEKTIAELKYRLEAHVTTMPLPPGVAPGAVAPPTPQAPGIRFTAPVGARQPPGAQDSPGVPVLENIPHLGRMFRYLPQTPELLALTQKVQALKQAADALTQAGMEDQARELRNAAERIQKEIELRRAEMVSRPDVAAPLGIASLAPHELHRSIRELTEQVQQLRKEVAEVRELLQRRQ